MPGQGDQPMGEGVSLGGRGQPVPGGGGGGGGGVQHHADVTP